MEPVCHTGVVKEVSSEKVRVLIEQISACDECRAKKFCSASDKREKIIDATVCGQQFSVGDRVVVTMRGSMGLRAVGIAYMLPLLLMIAVLFAVDKWFFPGRDGLAALLALGSLTLYYIVLACFHTRMGRHFVFEVKAMDTD